MKHDQHLNLIRKQHPEETHAAHLARLEYRVRHLKRAEQLTKIARVARYVDRSIPWLTVLLLLLILLLGVRGVGHAQTTNQNVNIARVGGTATSAGSLNVNCTSGCASSSFTFGAAFPASGVAIGAKFGANMVNLGADASSNLLVNCAVGCGASGFNDNGAFTTGTTTISNIGGLFDDTPPTAIVAGHAAAARITANRALHINLRNQAGTELATAGAPLRVDPTGATTQPVSGTVGVSNFPATQPISGSVSVSNFPATQAVSGTVTANQGTANTAANAWPAKVTDGTNVAAVKAASTAAAAADPSAVVALSPNSPLPAGSSAIGSVTATQATGSNLHVVVDTAPSTAVTGTVTANQGTANTAANGWPAKVTDGTNTANVKAASTAAAATDPALVVAVSPNNTIAATESGTWTMQPGNTANTTPWLATARVVGGAGTSLETTAGVLDENIKNVGNAAVSTAASGVQKVGVVGNAGGAFDAANNAAAPANVIAQGVEVIAQGSQPTAATAGNVRRSLASTEGVIFVQEGNSNRFSCLVQAATVTTQCQAAPGAGLRAYVTSAHFANQAATVQTLDIVFGTGAACVTGTTALTHKMQFGTNGTTTSPIDLHMAFQTPLVPTAANAICIRPSAATAFGATLTGYIAP